MFNDFSHALSNKELSIFNFISSNIIKVSKMNLKELSLELGVSEYSIDKFCKKLNIDNFENLNSVIREISKNYSESSNFIFKNYLNGFSNFINKIDENKILKISKLILKHKNLILLSQESLKPISNYLSQNLKFLNINPKITSSYKQIYKHKDFDLIFFLPSQPDEKNMDLIFKSFSNKIVIMISETLIKNAHDNCSVFIHLENQKIFKNFGVSCTGMYFVLCDLIISKLIELCNSKN